ncbi:MAG: glycosyltransferase family 39 protein [Gemmatimonadales bacterium]|nr:glycosyltransferase family 39 protein [Gemmatimonadales bacterium]
MLRPGGDPLPAGLIEGLWALKLLVVLHIGVAWLVARRLPGWSSRPEQGATRGEGLAIAGLLLVGLLLRLPGLDAGLWYDEIQTLVDYIRQPWGVLLTTFDSTNQHLLFSIAARASRAVFGLGAASLRLPAVLFGVASLWATLAFARRWLPAREAWWSAGILAVSYHHIWFSQNARGYTGLLLGTLLGSLLFLDLLRQRPPTRMAVWAYAWIMALSLLTHVTALVVLAAHGLVWLWQVRRLEAGRARWVPFIGLVLAGSVTVMLYAPVLPQMLTAVSTSGTSAPGIAWQRPGWFIAEAIAGLVRGIPAGIVLVPLAGLVVLTGLADAWRRDRVVVALMILPMATMAALVLAMGHNLWPRFFFFGAGFVVMWAVHGGFVVLDRVVPRLAAPVGHGGLGVVLLGSLVLLPRAWAPKQDYPAAAAWLAAHAAPGDAIVGTEMMDLPMNTWLGHAWPIVTDSTALRRIDSVAPRTWVLYTFPIRVQATAPGLWARLEEAYEVAEVIPATVGGGEIVIARQRDDGAPVQRTRASASPAPNQ